MKITWQLQNPLHKDHEKHLQKYTIQTRLYQLKYRKINSDSYPAILKWGMSASKKTENKNKHKTEELINKIYI